MSNFQNPLGSSMPEDSKIAVRDLLGLNGIPLIEDDVYSELYFSDTKPKSIKTYDDQGWCCIAHHSQSAWHLVLESGG